MFFLTAMEIIVARDLWRYYNHIMKRLLILILVVLSVFSFSSCARAMKEFSQEMTYSDPQTIGGEWTVYFDNGDVFNNAVCTYWGTEDDTSVWKLPDGTMLIQSGTVHAVQEVSN